MTNNEKLMPQTIDPAQIASIVRRVIQRIQQSSTTITNSTAASVNDKVITVATIEQLTGTPSQLFISAKTIVTPAARDAAKERGIGITRSVELPPDQVPNRNKPNDSEIIDNETPARALAVAAQLGRRGIDSIGSQIVLSETPAVDVHRCCGERSQRAVMIGSVADVDRFEAELHPEVWVLDMKRLNLMAAVNVVAKIALGTRL